MNDIKKLEELLKTDALVEVNENINELEEKLKIKNKKALQDELTYMLEVKKYFDEVLADIEENKLSENQAYDILEGLEEMKTDNH